MGGLRRIGASWALGYVFLLLYFFNCIFLTILKNLLKVLCLQMMTSRVAGRKMHRNGDGSSSGARDVLRRNMSQATRRCQYVFFFVVFFITFLYYVCFRLVSTYEGINEDSRHDASRVFRYVLVLIYILNYTNKYYSYVLCQWLRMETSGAWAAWMGAGVKWEARDA